MNPARWRRLQDFFHRARDLEFAAREAFVEDLRTKEPELGDELDSLLAADEAEGRLAIEARLLEREVARGEALVPGTLLAGRFRIVARLARGGMGEIYRCDDLKLGQPVALKLLPSEIEDDAELLARLHDEVRVARRVAHPNVCRVYDIGEADGHTFLSMEYVDGENLAALLRRIGHLPRGKAAQIGREICAGLAAAHRQGVIHRDLKPANILIDGRGRAHLTDFGLACESEAVAGAAAREGTVDYMAPEQLAGREATARSDLYALGLVLYELFTGHFPFAARSLRGALEERSAGPPASPSTYLGGLDSAVKRVILRCLEPLPGERPAGALAVAAALPGADPLTASLVAGETPSPETVAAAPTSATVSPWLAAGGVVFCLLGLVGGLALEYDQVLAPGGRPPVVLADRARQVLAELGHFLPAKDEGRGDEAWGYVWDRRVVDRLRESPEASSTHLEGGAPPLYSFWYRASPEPLLPWAQRRASRSDPPRGTPDSSLVTLDTEGRLVGLEVAPEPVELGVGPAEDPVLGKTLLELAGLDRSVLERVEPQSLPPHFTEERAAWAGRYPAGLELRVEAAATAGRATWLSVYSPALGGREPQPGKLPALFVALLLFLFVVVVAAGGWLARSNLRSGRGDRRGAARLGLLLGSVWLLVWIVGGTHRLALAEIAAFFRAVATALLLGALTVLLYLGLEPALRRRWPHRIISWTRLLDGRFRDPLVGRDLLAGAVATVLFLFLPAAWWQLGAYWGIDRPALVTSEFERAAWGVPGVIVVWPEALVAGVLFGLGFLVLLFVLTRAVRHEWLAAILLCGLMTFGACVRDGVTDPLHAAALSLPFVVGAAVMIRLGVLATVVLFVLAHLGILYPITRFDGGWWTGGRIVLLATLVAVAAYGAWCCTRRPAADSD